MKINFIKTIYPLVYVVFSVLFQCCDDTPEPYSRKAVIEGYLRSGEYPSVIFSSSIVPSISGNLADAVVNWGKVTVSDGDTTVILTGKVDDSIVPPFIYYSSDMEGIPGKTYTITAEFKDLHAYSEMTLPEPIGIDSITISPYGPDSLRSATVHFTSPRDTPAFFYLSMCKDERNARMYPCMMGSMKTDLPATHYSIPLLRPKIKIDSTKYISQLLVGEEWIVSLNRIERPIFDFWKAYDDMLMFSQSPFITTSESLPTNIKGGFGVWSVEGSSKMKLKVK